MRYAEFRDRLEGSLHEAGLIFFHSDRPVETIDLTDTARNWKVYVYRTPPPRADPFHVSAEIGFTWSPVESARGYTCEEDLLAALVGRRRRRIRWSQGACHEAICGNRVLANSWKAGRYTRVTEDRWKRQRAENRRDVGGVDGTRTRGLRRDRPAF